VFSIVSLVHPVWSFIFAIIAEILLRRNFPHHIFSTSASAAYRTTIVSKFYSVFDTIVVVALHILFLLIFITEIILLVLI
jgi:hypothetical protein